MDTWNKIKSAPVILGVAIAILSQVAATGFRSVAENKGVKLMAPLDSISISQSNLNISDYNLTQIEINKIEGLCRIILKHKEQHKLTFLTLYQFLFSSVSLLTIFSILSRVLAFVVGQKGWKLATRL